jgi:hypothetical protein
VQTCPGPIRFRQSSCSTFLQTTLAGAGPSLPKKQISVTFQLDPISGEA